MGRRPPQINQQSGRVRVLASLFSNGRETLWHVFPGGLAGGLVDGVKPPGGVDGGGFTWGLGPPATGVVPELSDPPGGDAGPSEVGVVLGVVWSPVGSVSRVCTGIMRPLSTQSRMPEKSPPPSRGLRSST